MDAQDEECQVQALIESAKNRDEQAETEWLRRYESFIHGVVLRRLDGALPGESEDIVQWVLLDFFTALRDGRVEFRGTPALLGLLKQLAVHRTCRMLHEAERRGAPLTPHAEADGAFDVASDEPDPSAEFAAKAFLHGLDPDDAALLRRRTSGELWKKLAAGFGATPDALRMRRKRLLERFEDEVVWRGDEPTA